MYDTSAEKPIVNDSYYAIAHFSRFVKKNAKRILSSSFGNVEAVAFKNPDDSLVCVIMNTVDEAVDYVLRIGELTTKLTINSESIQTLIIYDMH